MGKAGEMLIRLSHEITLQKLISEFESEYCDVENTEQLLGKMFNCKPASR